VQAQVTVHDLVIVVVQSLQVAVVYPMISATSRSTFELP